MREYFITAKKNPRVFEDIQIKGAVETYTMDASGWADDNNPIIGATWELVSGQAAISNEVLAAGKANARVTFSEAGGSLIKLTLQTVAEQFVAHLSVSVKDPMVVTDDYGLCRS